MEKATLVKKEGYDIMEVFDHVQEKYELDVIFMDFWHWFVMAYEPDNGVFIHLDTSPNSGDDDEIKLVKEKLAIEYGAEIPLYVTY